jgi:hypothetical protein
VMLCWKGEACLTPPLWVDDDDDDHHDVDDLVPFVFRAPLYFSGSTPAAMLGYYVMALGTGVACFGMQ